MIATLTMELEVPEGVFFSFQKSSLLQGVLMEHISPEYALKLHENCGCKQELQKAEKLLKEQIKPINTEPLLNEDGTPVLNEQGQPMLVGQIGHQSV